MILDALRNRIDVWLRSQPDKYERTCRAPDHLCVCGRHRHRQRHVVIVDAATLRRRRIYYCGRAACRLTIQGTSAAADRTRRDWQFEQPSAPVALEPILKPQYPSRSRRTLRAFVESGLEAAMVEGDASSLNLSAGTLGISEVYAEQRGGATALRRNSRARR